MQFAWRQMEEQDLGTVSAIAAAVHPTLPEDDAIFAEKLALYPAGCFLLGDGLGYLLSHPWPAGAIPKINTRLGAIPPEADSYYLHDLALLPQARGQKAGRHIIEHVAATIRLPRLALVAVSGSRPFWERQGFVADSLAVRGYGDDALYMTRAL